MDWPRDGRAEAFRQGLEQLGYVEGENLCVEYRFADLQFDRLPALAAELVGLPVDVLVVGDTRSIQPAKQATASLPVALVLTTDPVASGHVVSLARPGGNITGLTMAPLETMGKRLELLRDAMASLTQAALLYNPADGLASRARAVVQDAAAALSIGYSEIAVRQPDDIPLAFERVRREGIEGLVVYGDPLMNHEAPRVAHAALVAGVPTVGMSREVTQAGLLMSYGPHLPALFRRAAVYVDKILRGAPPAEIPVERPRTFELVINLRTAATIGLTIPPLLLSEADDVIQ